MAKYSLFLNIMARDNPIDGGASIRSLKSETLDDAKAEAEAVIAKEAPEDGCDFFCDYAAVVETVSVTVLRNGV